jgi:hypothetical protein
MLRRDRYRLPALDLAIHARNLCQIRIATNCILFRNNTSRLIPGRPDVSIRQIADIDIESVRITCFVTCPTSNCDVAQFRAAASHFAETNVVLAVREQDRLSWRASQQITIAREPCSSCNIRGHRLHRTLDCTLDMMRIARNNHRKRFQRRTANVVAGHQKSESFVPRTYSLTVQPTSSAARTQITGASAPRPRPERGVKNLISDTRSLGRTPWAGSVPQVAGNRTTSGHINGFGESYEASTTRIGATTHCGLMR